MMNLKANGYQELPQFPEVAPDPSVRNVEVSIRCSQLDVAPKPPPTLLPHTVPLCLLLIFWRTDYENIVTAFKIEPVWGTSSRKKTGKAKKTSFYSESETESGSESGMKGVVFYFVLLFVKKMSVFV